MLRITPYKREEGKIPQSVVESLSVKNLFPLFPEFDRHLSVFEKEIHRWIACIFFTSLSPTEGGL